MSFRWTLFKETEDVQRFIGVLKQKIYVLDQNLDNIQYSAYLNSNNCTNKSASSLESEVKAELIEYFRLDLNLEGKFKMLNVLCLQIKIVSYFVSQNQNCIQIGQIGMDCLKIE
jgi:hypothetical protein